MNLDVSKWNPFKFSRRSSETRRPEAGPQPAGSGSPAGWGDAGWAMTTDPLRMMQETMHDPFAGLGPLDRWFGDYSPGVFQPRIDVVDEGDALRITAELPGMERKEVEVIAEDDAIILRGEKKHETKSEEKGCYRVERAFGSFQRVIPLPDGVEVARAEGKFDKGVLTLRLPKSAAEKSDARRIEIK